MLATAFSSIVFNLLILGSKALRLFYFEFTVVRLTWVERKTVMALGEIGMKS